MRGDDMPRFQKRTLADILPAITWDSIAPPYPHYPYFSGADSYSFRPHAEKFDPVNAWWLIEAATLAYADEVFVRQEFNKVGLSKVAPFSGGSTQCYVASNDDFVLVVFRGTEIRPRANAKFDFRNIIRDIRADAIFLPVDFAGHGKVHLGFKLALEEVWQENSLLGYLTALRDEDGGARPVWFTGHSLGAAVATLAAALHGSVQGLYTFGSPKVGNFRFSRHFAVRTFRFVNNMDIITQLPPFFYSHVGELLAIDGDGRISQSGQVQEFPDYLWTFLTSMWTFDTEISSYILDHIPTLYATHLWNFLIENVPVPRQ
jgi:hypothetical protein